MDPNNQQPNTAPVNPVTPGLETNVVPSPEAPKPIENNLPTPEVVSVGTPELTSTPSPEVPKAAEIDHISDVAAPVDISEDQNIAKDPTLTIDNPVTVTPPITNENELNKRYFAAVDNVTKNADKPFEEEEQAEDLQIGYLADRFGKELKKSDD